MLWKNNNIYTLNLNDNIWISFISEPKWAICVIMVGTSFQISPILYYRFDDGVEKDKDKYFSDQ